MARRQHRPARFFGTRATLIGAPVNAPSIDNRISGGSVSIGRRRTLSVVLFHRVFVDGAEAIVILESGILFKSGFLDKRRLLVAERQH